MLKEYFHAARRNVEGVGESILSTVVQLLEKRMHYVSREGNMMLCTDEAEKMTR